METESIEYIFRTFITLALYVTAPILVITFVAAIGIGIIQSMMQIQEQTLSFAPKLIIIAVLLFVMSSSMLQEIVQTLKDTVKLAPDIF